MISADDDPREGVSHPDVPVPILCAVQDPDSVSPCGVGSAIASEATDMESISALQANQDDMAGLCGSVQRGTPEEAN